MVRLNNEQLGSAFWLAVGVLVVLHAPSYGLGTLSSPGTGFMPFVAGWAMCLFAFIGLVQGTIQKRKGAGWKPILRDVAWPKAFLVLGALLFYVVLLPRLGFILCTILFLGFLFRCVKPMRWGWVAFGSVLCTLASWGVFELLLNVPLPKSIWGI
jgi:putative tricarboxylic transport membrane protein